MKTIECRYQKWTRNGIEWTQWFQSLTDGASDDITLLEEKISLYKKRDKESRMKLKHEYRIADYIEPPIIEHKEKKTRKNKSNKAAGVSKKSK